MNQVGRKRDAKNPKKSSLGQERNRTDGTHKVLKRYLTGKDAVPSIEDYGLVGRKQTPLAADPAKNECENCHSPRKIDFRKKLLKRSTSPIFLL
jgi:hypothetical protein